MAEQTDLRFPQSWGGARPGAGRPKGSRTSAAMPHTTRAVVSRHRPHHVTVKFAKGTWNLRSQRCFRPIRDALRAITRRAGFRVVHFSVQHNHVHLVTEANDRRALANGLRALLIRVARGLNRVMGARGRRVADRYHEHVLRTPSEVRNALRYVLDNRAHHLAQWGPRLRPQTSAGALVTAGAPAGFDPFTSLATGPPGGESLVRPPGSWLLREGWLRPSASSPRHAGVAFTGARERTHGRS